MMPLIAGYRSLRCSVDWLAYLFRFLQIVNVSFFSPGRLWQPFCTCSASKTIEFLKYSCIAIWCSSGTLEYVTQENCYHIIVSLVSENQTRCVKSLLMSVGIIASYPQHTARVLFRLLHDELSGWGQLHLAVLHQCRFLQTWPYVDMSACCSLIR